MCSFLSLGVRGCAKPSRMTDPTTGSMLRKELLAVVKRYGQESDVTVYQLIGALEVVKQDVLDMFDNLNKDDE